MKEYGLGLAKFEPSVWKTHST